MLRVDGKMLLTLDECLAAHVHARINVALIDYSTHSSRSIAAHAFQSSSGLSIVTQMPPSGMTKMPTYDAELLIGVLMHMSFHVFTVADLNVLKKQATMRQQALQMVYPRGITSQCLDQSFVCSKASLQCHSFLIVSLIK